MKPRLDAVAVNDNCSLGLVVTEFVLRGFPQVRQLELSIFTVCSTIFTFTLLGNLIIIAIVVTDSCLHTPMYFFLGNLSLLEISFTSAVVPKMLANLLAKRKTISFSGCITQCYFYFFLGSTELLLLAVMSIDRYVAICNPLRYVAIMNIRVCISLALGCWVGGFLLVLLPILVISQLPYCGPNVINHFFCDSTPLLKLSCCDIRLIELGDILLASVLLTGTLLVIMVSYIYIISTVLKIPSAAGRSKAFSTCASHVTVVTIYYGSATFMHAQPAQSSALEFSKVVAVLITVVTPFLNPLIYSLRNEKVKEALKDMVKWRSASLRKMEPFV
ncbi:olfactory receptor 6M1-like [Sphaerodactylus townsendi]|uniref:olfactory receptor 6M1-like n=1 Tax=Sphaerodactylus townsendi TaxID=933632 RepID=UPI002026A301|nr:olfactory receptor 6M1-like [Sphaerodactylus townsendi]